MIHKKDFPIHSEATLRKPCAPVLNKLHAQYLKKVLEEQFPKEGALGVACPQIGIHSKASLIRMPGSSEFLFICNPEILALEDEFVFCREGCLSFPKVYKDTLRFKTVKVKYWDENFEERIVQASGIEAVVFQHEIGHLNGDLFFDHLQQPIRVEPKQGRNEKCACGSGKKFKNCHGGN